jgi:hypothetical protein
MRIVVLTVSLALAGCASEGAAKPEPVAPRSDVRAEIVAASIYGYEVNVKKPCPCPYSRGGTCEKNAYVTPGGAEPRCYKSDVTAEDIKRWQKLVRESAGRHRRE